MEDLNGQVLLAFDIKARKITKEKSQYIVTVNGGARAIRSVFETREHVAFQHAVKEHMCRNGFADTDRFYLTVSGLPYCEYDGSLYVMTDVLRGKELDFLDEAELLGAIKTLAAMHKAAEGAPAGFIERDDPVSEIQKDLAWLGSVKKRVNAQKRLYDFDVMFLKNYGFYTDQLERCLDELRRGDPAALNACAAERGMVCHNAIKGKYILIGAGKTSIVNFSAAAARHVCADIAAFVRRYGKTAPAGRVNINTLVGAYLSVNPLSARETAALRPLIRRPASFLKVCGQYYNKKRTWTPGAISAKIEDIVRGGEEFAAYVDELEM